MLLGALCLAPTAQAIAIRTDVPASAYSALALDSAYASAGFFTAGCSGVLVSATQVLTAAHCSGAAASAFSVSADRAGATTWSVSSVAVNPLYSSGTDFGHDLAIATLGSAVLGIAPAAISQADPLGSEVKMLGYGAQLDASGAAVSSVHDRLAATNVIDGIMVPGNLWVTDFDSPAGDANLLGFIGSAATPTALEGQLAGGDSGGPLFLFGELLGINVGIFCLPDTCTAGVGYGNGSVFVRLDTPDNLAFLAANGIAVAPVPLPASVWLLLSGLLGVITLSYRRKTVGGLILEGDYCR